VRKNPFIERKIVINGIFISIGIIFILRLLQIQIFDNSYTLSANNNVLRYVTEYPSRGLIFDRNGKLLVYNEATYDLMVVPRLVKKIDTAGFCNLILLQTFCLRKAAL
jgi:penicillin-binding protein 2